MRALRNSLFGAAIAGFLAGGCGGGGGGVVNPPPPVKQYKMDSVDVAEIHPGELVTIRVVDESGIVPEVNDAVWTQEPAEPAGLWRRPIPGPAQQSWQSPQISLAEPLQFTLGVQIASLNFKGSAVVRLIPSGTPIQPKISRISASPTRVKSGEDVLLLVETEPQVVGAVVTWKQEPIIPAGRFFGAGPDGTVGDHLVWKAPEVAVNTEFTFTASVKVSASITLEASVKVLVEAIPAPTEEEIRELVRQLACVKDAAGQWRLTRWVSKNVQVLVSPSAQPDLQVVRDGCKLWENAGYGFAFDVQLSQEEYGLTLSQFPPPGSVGIANQSGSNPPNASRWNRSAVEFGYDTGLIRIWRGDNIGTVTHELWHILVSSEENYNSSPPHPPLTKAAIQFIWSHQPGDVV